MRISRVFSWLGSLAVVVNVIVPIHLPAQSVEKEGAAWLASRTDPAQVNVDGIWESAEWGTMLLHQAQNAREINGTADNWEITGVASGKQIFLVFSSRGTVTYTAQLALSGDDELTGNWGKSLRAPDRTMTFIRPRTSGGEPAGAKTPPGAGATDPAHVVVYREHYHNCPQVKAAVYIDGKEVADVQNGRYLTVTLPPGKYLIGTSKVGYMGSQTEQLDLATATTTYVHFNFPSAWVCTIEIDKINAAEATAALEKLKPNDAKRVKMPELVSLEPIGK